MRATRPEKRQRFPQPIRVQYVQQKITCKRRRQHQRQRQNHIQFALYQPRELLQRQTFVSFTPHTITDIPTLLQKLSECREAGYAIENGEYKIGLCSISAPVFTRDGTVAYTTGVIGMFRSIHCDEFAAAVEQVRATASMISAALGYRPDRAT